MGERLEEISKRWASYLSPQVFDSIFSSGTTVSEKHWQKYLTVFFSDIVSFTDLTVTPRLLTKAAPHQARHYHCPQPKPDYQILAPAPDRLSDRSKAGNRTRSVDTTCLFTGQSKAAIFGQASSKHNHVKYVAQFGKPQVCCIPRTDIDIAGKAHPLFCNR